MLTAVRPTQRSETLTDAATDLVSTEPVLSDEEILRRVRDIKSTWSPAERARRRLEADRRFETLLDTLFAEAA